MRYAVALAAAVVLHLGAAQVASAHPTWVTGPIVCCGIHPGDTLTVMADGALGGHRPSHTAPFADRVYTWERCWYLDDSLIRYCAYIPGAEGPDYTTYRLTTNDLGYRVRVRITVRESDGYYGSKTGVPVGPIRSRVVG